MPQNLESIIQQMIDAGESEENIASVIREYKGKEKAQQPYTGPTSFWGGVGESLKSGEAAKAGLQGGLGWLKGATVDLPQSVVGGLQTIGNLVTDPVGTISSIPSGIQSMWETTKRAGTEPEAFGRMMGQTTGQPLTTAGLVKAAPAVTRAAGTPVAATGELMQKWQPLSGMLPNFADIRTFRNLEGYLGGKIRNIGERMRMPTVEGEIVQSPTPLWQEGQFRPAAPELPASNVRYGTPAEPYGVIPETTATQGIQPPRGPVTPSPSPLRFTEGEIIPPAQLSTGTPNPNVRIGYPSEPSGYIPRTTQTQGIQPISASPAPDVMKGMPTTIKLKQKFLSPETVKSLINAGYKFVNMDEKGGFIFKKAR